VSGPALGSTYRLQLHGLGLAGATRLVPYLSELGIETLYLSPVLAATPGSTHGYDVVDPGRIDPAIGTDQEFHALLDELTRRDMHVLLDIVPNHMAADPANAWWWDVLARGVESPHAVVFDIDWTRHGGRVLVPALARPLADVLAEGRCELTGGVLTLDGQPFPTSAATPAGGSPAADLAAQHFRPAYWRTADTEGNYRRFFDIATLVGVRVEDPDVFARTHARVVELSRHPAVAGLRVDHVDGLADPRTYLLRLHHQLEGGDSDKAILVEKILAPDEALDPRWPVEGTTGYEFADRATSLFLEPSGCARLLELGAELTGTADPSFATLAAEGKREVLERSFSSDLDRLTRLTLGALDDEMPGHDLAPRDLRRVWVELTVSLSVYRTYLGDGGPSSPSDLERLARTAAAVGAQGGHERRRALAAVTRGLLERADSEGPWVQVARRWQQLSGAVMAKGAEDTATYRYAGVPVRAEVGGDPDDGGDAVAAFHRLVPARAGGLNATSTHDSKRNEDARSRLAVTSEADGEWASLVRGWHRLCALPGDVLPGPTEELAVYHSLLALWPPTAGQPDQGTIDRVKGYVVKAAREAKLRTSWSEPDESYEYVVTSFVDALVARHDFRAQMTSFSRATAPAVLSNVLGLVVLKTWAAGVPDFYEGTELMEPALTDPDNRRPVDFAARASLLESLPEASPAAATQLLSSWPDGRIKLQVTRELLHERRRQPALFASGSYEPLAVTSAHAVAFWRRLEDAVALAVVSRLTYGLAGPGRFAVGTEVWRDETVVLPEEAPTSYRDVLTGREIHADSGCLRLSDVLEILPVAALRASTR
jgi:(1->4)-alpha-D-glucan 1-alpha-D-glucosylmutase